MKFNPKVFYALAIGLASTLTTALATGAVPAQYVPYVSGLSMLLTAFLQKK